MKKAWMLKLGKILLVVLFIYVVIRMVIGTSLVSDHFPLSQKWKAKLWGNVSQILIINDQIVLVRTTQDLYAVEAKSGNILWQHDLNWQTISQPAFSKNGIIFYTDTKGVWALNQSDGTVIWTDRVGKTEIASVVSVSQEYVAVNGHPNLYLYRAKDGALQWKEYGCRNIYRSYFHDTHIYLACFDLVSRENSTGDKSWKTEPEFFNWTPAFEDGVMYSSLDRQTITADDLVTQVKLWNTHLPNSGIVTLTVIAEYLAFTDSTQFCLLQRNDGKKLWCAPKRKLPQNPVIIGNGAYIFNGPQNIISAYDLSSGAPLGQLTLFNLNVFSIEVQKMVAADNLLIFASGNEVFAFGE